MGEPFQIRDDVETVDSYELRWSRCTLRSLTAEGTAEDVSCALGLGTMPRRCVGTFMKLLEQQRPDLYDRFKPSGHLMTWAGDLTRSPDRPSPDRAPTTSRSTSRTPPRSTRNLPLPRPSETSRRFDLGDLPDDDALRDLALYMLSLVSRPFVDLSVPLPAINTNLTDYRGWWWLRSCAHLLLTHQRTDLLETFIGRVLLSCSDERSESVLGMLHQQLIDSGRLNEPPHAIAPDTAELKALTAQATRGEVTFTEDDHDTLARMIAGTLRHDPTSFDAIGVPPIKDGLESHAERHAWMRALARAFPLWDDGFERELLPLDDELLELIVQSCARIDAGRPSTRTRTQTLSFRRLFALILGWDSPNKDIWLTRAVTRMVASAEVTSLTRCVICLDLFLTGDASLAQLSLWGSDMGRPREEEQ